MIAMARYGLFCLPRGLSALLVRGRARTAPIRLRVRVVVTAQRSVSGLQTTPLAVTALSGPALKTLNVTDLDSLALAVPGVSFGDELGEAHIAIRGIGSDAVNPGADPRVAYYQDGIYIGRPTAQLGAFRPGAGGGPERSSGHPVWTQCDRRRDQRHQPRTTAQASGYADVSYGNYNTVDFDGAIGGPIADTVAGRIAMQTKFHDGYEPMSPRAATSTIKPRKRTGEPPLGPVGVAQFPDDRRVPQTE